MEQQAVGERSAIVVVDDDHLVLKAMQRVLGKEFRVFPASGIGEAKDILDKQGDIRLIISDYRMGGGNSGVELLEYAMRTRPAIGRILVSGSLLATHAQRAVETRVAHAYLPKPWDNRLLLETVRKHCR